MNDFIIQFGFHNVFRSLSSWSVSSCHDASASKDNEEVSFVKIYFYYLTLLILCTFLKCGYISVRNGLAFWNHDLTTKILPFANTCILWDKNNNNKKWFGSSSLLLKCIIVICIFFVDPLMLQLIVRLSRQDYEYFDISALFLIEHTLVRSVRYLRIFSPKGRRHCHSINLLAFYYECRSLVSYYSHCLSDIDSSVHLLTQWWPLFLRLHSDLC